jgi:pectate lyase
MESRASSARGRVSRIAPWASLLIACDLTVTGSGAPDATPGLPDATVQVPGSSRDSGPAPLPPPADGGGALLPDAAIADAGPATTPGAAAGTLLRARTDAELALFVNGAQVGAVLPAAAATLTATLPLREGSNVIVVRARSDGARPFVAAALSGRFGRVITGSGWRAARGTAADLDGVPAATQATFDDSGWAPARAVEVDPGDAQVGAAVWGEQGAEFVLLRLVLYVPLDYDAHRPLGVAASATGGAGGQVVRVRDTRALADALCAKRVANGCADDTPRIVELEPMVYDFTGSEGRASENGCYVKECADPGARQQILNRQNWCAGRAQFPVSYDVAGTTPLVVGSNKTLIGVGSGAVLRGKGLALRGGVSNVVLRNFTISDVNADVVWGGDGLTLDDAARVWVDHLRFARIGRQMVVTGFGSAEDVTFSFNELDGRSPFSATCDGTHYWTLLLLGERDRLSFVGNWIHHVSGRTPHAGGLMDARNAVQLANNLISDVPGHALEPLTDGTHLLLEGNVFERVAALVGPTDDPGHVLGPESAMPDLCSAALGRPCEPNLLIDSAGSLPVDVETLSGFDATARARAWQPFEARYVPASVPHLAGPLL